MYLFEIENEWKMKNTEPMLKILCFNKYEKLNKIDFQKSNFYF